MKPDEIRRMAQEAGLYSGNPRTPGTENMIVRRLERFAALVAAAERERICEAIKFEDDYCVDNGDYMLDSNDCIAIARGTWSRPEFAASHHGEIRARGQA